MSTNKLVALSNLGFKNDMTLGLAAGKLLEAVVQSGVQRRKTLEESGKLMGIVPVDSENKDVPKRATPRVRVQKPEIDRADKPKTGHAKDAPEKKAAKKSLKTGNAESKNSAKK